MASISGYPFPQIEVMGASHIAGGHINKSQSDVSLCSLTYSWDVKGKKIIHQIYMEAIALHYNLHKQTLNTFEFSVNTLTCLSITLSQSCFRCQLL